MASEEAGKSKTSLLFEKGKLDANLGFWSDGEHNKTNKYEALLAENSRLKKQLLHVDTLGRMVADCKQSNLILAKENGELQETVEQLLRMQTKDETMVSDPRQYTHQKFAEEHQIHVTSEDVREDRGMEVADSSSQPSATRYAPAKSCATAVFRESSLITTQGGSTHDGNDNSGSFGIVSNSNSSYGNDTTTTQNETPDAKPIPKPHNTNESKSSHTLPQVRQDNHRATSAKSTIFQQGREVDDLFASTDNDSENNGSVNVQFEKLSEVFNGLAQHVTQAQKKTRNTQAFCEAVLRNNDKLKQDLEREKTRVSELEKLIEKKDLEIAELSMDNGGDKTSNPNGKSSISDVETQAENEKEADNSKSATDSAVFVLQNFARKLQSRIEKLESQRAEILRVNKQWHSQYNKLKEDCNAKLSKYKEDMERLKQQIAERRTEGSKHKRDIDFILREAQEEVEVLQRQKGDLARNFAVEHSRTQKLNEKIEKLKMDLSCINAENKRLNQALEAAYSVRQSRHQHSCMSLLYDGQMSKPEEDAEKSQLTISTGEKQWGSKAAQGEDPAVTSREVEDLKTHIEVLQEQVKIYREDFETERRDREKSQAEKQRLSDEMSRMGDEMRALSQQVRAHEQDFRQERREKQRLQRQLSRVRQQAMTGGNDHPLMYDIDVPGIQTQRGPRRYSPPTKDRARYRDTRTEIEDPIIQNGAASQDDASRRYDERTRTNELSPLAHDSRRRRKTTATISTRRIRDEYHEPPPLYQRNVAYPSVNILE